MERNPKENITITTIEFQMEHSGKENVIFSFVVPFLSLFFAVTGLIGCFMTSFGVQANLVCLYVGLFFFALFWTLFSRWKVDGMYRFLGFIGVLVVANILLFIMQTQAISGFFQTANAIFESLNESYHGSIVLYQTSVNEMSVSIFLLYVMFVITGLLSLAIIRKQNVWVLAAVAFPILFGSCLVQGEPAGIYLCFLFFSFLGLLAESALEEPYSLEKNEKEKYQGTYYQEVKSRVMLSSFLPFLVLSVIAFFILSPLLVRPITYAREVGGKSENGVLQVIWSVLPGTSDSDLKVEGVGGGVDEGALGKTDGYYFGNVKALKLICDQRPEGTLYLKGYIGSVYTGESFDAANEDDFRNAAYNWKIDGDSSIYVQNLPFLRMMYAENLIVSEEDEEDQQLSEELTSSAMELQVENLNANPAYTYVPYNAFLNDYYEVLAGDGAVASQDRAADIFSYYPIEAFEEKMEEWSEQEDAHGVLDSVEASYESYVKSKYLQVPETGLEELKAECEEADLDDIEEIKEYIITRLSETATFKTDVESLPEGEDFVSWFLYESQEGYSVHFAATATMMFRMFDVPARYVVGYVAPERLFTMQSDGSYMAVIEDDDAHAWTEIYISGTGWVPVETTPGFVAMVTDGTGSNAGAGETVGDEEDTQAEETDNGENDSDENDSEAGDTAIFGNSGMKIWQIVLGCLVAVLCVVAIVFIVRRKRLVKKRLGLSGRTDVAGNIRYVYHSFSSLLAFDGWNTAPGCEDEEFSQQLANKYQVGSAEAWERFAMIVLRTYYGYDKRTKDELQFLRRMYVGVCREVKKKLTFGERMKFYWGKCYM